MAPINKDYYDSLPRKRMGAGVLIFNENNELLVVKPNYKDHWSTPGGTIDQNESPRSACLRETREEVGISLKDVRFLCVDYTDDNIHEKGESLQFVFYGGTLSDEDVKNIRLDPAELDAFKFVSVDEAASLLGHKLAVRLSKCIEAIKTGTAVYLENGEF